ncbi:MAG: DUF1152 domain-containing protein [Candidatus Melainabacteria bacterium]|nr:DUF1152 domain-containing protein [Candidatus Melainabacteria bacterium]
MLEPTFIKQLRSCKNVLIVGAGGGFDVFAGLPLFFALREAGVGVHLANLSFSFRHGEISGRSFGPNVVEVNARSTGNDYYFPEGYLAKWLSRKRMDQPIYCIRVKPVADIVKSYQRLQEHLKFDMMVLVDGGVDSLMRGDESRIGTPLEDMMSLAAALQIDVPKQLLCLGLGAETDVCHLYALETVAHLIKANAFLGGLMLSPDMPEVQNFVEATQFVFHEMRGYESVICSSIMSALEGHFGDHHRTRRTIGAELWINPLMLLYLAFDVTKVTENVLYFNDLAGCATIEQVRALIREFRDKTPIRKLPTFPMR